jgi:NAD(P)-dependent dehydrogenase (short-subunit alcohol dehydrogenase family)
VARAARIARDGSLTLVSGGLAARPRATAVLQGAINAAVESLGRGLALELAPVRVNTVRPGLIDTPLWDGMDRTAYGQMMQRARENLPAGRPGTAADIGAAVLFLIGNGFATGSTLTVDGGGTIA